MAKKVSEGKKRLYRFIVITLAFLLLGGSIFVWLPQVKAPLWLLILLGSVFLAAYLTIIVWSEISYRKRKVDGPDGRE